MEFAQAYYYEISDHQNEYGKKSLPEVSGYKVDAVEAKDYTYNGSACRGYDVKLTLTYGRNGSGESEEVHDDQRYRNSGL